MAQLNRRWPALLAVASLCITLLLPSEVLAGVTSGPVGIVGDASTASSPGDAVSNVEWKALLTGKGALGSYHRADGTLVVVVPSSGSSSFRASDAAAFGLAVSTEKRDIEPQDVSDIKALVGKSQWTPEAGNAAPFAYFSPRLGKVRIFSDAPAAEFAHVLERFPTQAILEGRPISFASRHADYPPHWGGAEMDGPDVGTSYDCTSGFSVKSGSLQRMVTASHCFENIGNTVFSPAGSWFGTVQRRENFPINDFELVGSSGITMGATIYCKQSATSSCDVTGAANPNFSNVYCFSGATSWEGCQQDLVDDDVTVCHNQGCSLYTPHMALFDGPVGFGVCPGDSGSPWYRYTSGNDIIIAGITSLGEDWDDDLNGCKQYAQLSIIEKWTKIRDTYSVTVMT